MQERKFRVTASNFGEICKATEKKDLQSLSERLYNPPRLHTPAIMHGRACESKAIQKFAEKNCVQVLPAGLFVDPEKPFLGASPDGVVDEVSLLEVKCPYSARNEKISAETVHFLCPVGTSLSLKRNHNYYYQVQGQLALAKRKFCFFVVYTFQDIFVEKIPFDLDFFSSQMLPNLTKFYEDFYRPYVASQF